MKISINIQSYKRAGKLGKILEIAPNANIWVHEFEVKEYKEHYKNVKELPDKYRGSLPAVKNHILDMESRDNDVTLFLDDDIGHIAYWENLEANKIKNEEELLWMIEKYTILCKEWGYKLWGINVNQDKQTYKEYSPFSTLSYVSASFSCFLKENKLRYDPRFPLKEDYDMAIQQCNIYRGLLRVNRYYYSKKSAENVGGCALYRSVKKEMEQIKELQKKWGDDIVKVDGAQKKFSKKVKKYDINPIIRVPIAGV